MSDPSKQNETELEEEFKDMSAEAIRLRTHLLNTEREMLEGEVRHIGFNTRAWGDKAAENEMIIERFNRTPYLIATVMELLELEMDQEEDGANVDLDARRTKGAIIKTTTRATTFLPVVGLVPVEQLKPGDLVGVNKDSFLILEKMPPDYDPRVRTMEVVERPTEKYEDVGGCEKQIEELQEAVVLPMTQREKFVKLGIRPPKGVLLYGPPGTGKTMLARAVAAQTKSTFLKLAATQLVQMYIGDGARLVRDAFALAREKAPTIIFIDELDAIGSKRFNSSKSGDREAQRTLLELLNQLDGFTQNDDIKLIAATNRVDILDPALVRSGRIDKKIELPLPDKEAREKILKIHSRSMTVEPGVNFEELSRCTDGFNGAQCKAVCVEAGMIALRRDAAELIHNDFMDGILEVQARKKPNLAYYI